MRNVQILKNFTFQQRFPATFDVASNAVADEDAFCEILDSLAEQYQEARAVYVKNVIPYKEEKRREKIAVVTACIRKGDVEKALKVVKE